MVVERDKKRRKLTKIENRSLGKRERERERIKEREREGRRVSYSYTTAVGALASTTKHLLQFTAALALYQTLS